MWMGCSCSINWNLAGMPPRAMRDKVQCVSLLPYKLWYDCPRQSSQFEIRCAEHHPLGIVTAEQLDKLEFIDPIYEVTFLYPNKKVTKEVVRGEAFRANRMNCCALATGKRPI